MRTAAEAPTRTRDLMFILARCRKPGSQRLAKPTRQLEYPCHSLALATLAKRESAVYLFIISRHTTTLTVCSVNVFANRKPP